MKMVRQWQFVPKQLTSSNLSINIEKQAQHAVVTLLTSNCCTWVEPCSAGQKAVHVVGGDLQLQRTARLQFAVHVSQSFGEEEGSV